MLNNTTNKHFVTTDMFYLPSREDILKQIDFYERRYSYAGLQAGRPGLYRQREAVPSGRDSDRAV